MLVYGVWLALAGGVAVLAGLAGARRRHRLRATGLTTWAMVLPTAPEPAEAVGGSGVSVQFALDDGRVIERALGQAARRSAALRPGEHVLVWYDPADPSDVLVYRSDGRWSDRSFLVAGAVLVAVGVALAGMGG